MRNSIYLWLIALLLWIPASFWLFSSILGCCGFMGPGLSIKDGAAFGASHGSNLTYGLSSAAYLMPAGVKDEFGKLATYLKKNPDRELTLTGQYDDNEKVTAGTNLGTARAQSLKKYLVGLGVAGSQIATAGTLKTDLSWDEDDKNVFGAVAYSFDELSSGISISDGSKFSAAHGENLNFNQSSDAYNTPLNANVKDVFQKAANYLKSNPTRTMMLTGFFMKNETNSSALPSLGMARANSVKNLLTSMGAPANQVDIEGQENSSLKLTDNSILGGIKYTISEKNNNKLAAVTKRLTSNPLILYFQTGSNELSLDNSQKSFLADLIYYLDNKADGGAVATGHTDNAGSTSANTRLSRKRAEFVKTYLVRKGINGSKIATDGKGPTVPIATNDTDEGKAKNRRVEITIK